MIRALAVLALVALGCAGENDAARTVASAGLEAPATSPLAENQAAPPAQAFDHGAAQPDSGVLYVTFYVPTYDNRGTCEAPEPDSTYPGSALWARVFYERRVYDGTNVYDETRADSFRVAYGQTVNWWRRVPVDTFTANVRLYKGTHGSCRKYKTQVVQASGPPTPVLPAREQGRPRGMALR